MGDMGGCLHVGEREAVVGGEDVGGDDRQPPKTPLVGKRESGVVDMVGGGEVGEVCKEIAVRIADLLGGLLDFQHLTDAQ